MELTGIGQENKSAFENLMYGNEPSDYDICIGAIEEGQAAGVAFYNAVEDALMLDYIYVAQKYRRRGIATALLEEFLEEIKDEGVVSVHVNFPERANDLYEFIRSRKFMIFRDGTAYRVSANDILRSEVTGKLFKKPAKNRVITLSDMTNKERGILKKAIDKEGLEPKILDDSSLAGRLSLVTLDTKNEHPTACVLCRQYRKEICIMFLINFSRDPIQLVDLIRALKDAVEKEELLDCDLTFVTMDDDMRRLPETLVSSKDMLISEGRVISAARMTADFR